MKKIFIITITIIFLVGCVSDSCVKSIPIEYFNDSCLDTVIPHIILNDVPLLEAFNALRRLWQKELPDQEIPEIIILGKLNHNYPSVTLEAKDIPVRTCIKVICRSTVLEYEVIQGNVLIKAPPTGIIEDWDTRIYELTATQKKALGINDSVLPEKLKKRLVAYGIEMPNDINAYVKWDNRIDRIIVFTYTKEQEKLKLLLQFMDVKGKEK